MRSKEGGRGRDATKTTAQRTALNEQAAGMHTVLRTVHRCEALTKVAGRASSLQHTVCSLESCLHNFKNSD